MKALVLLLAAGCGHYCDDDTPFFGVFLHASAATGTPIVVDAEVEAIRNVGEEPQGQSHGEGCISQQITGQTVTVAAAGTVATLAEHPDLAGLYQGEIVYDTTFAITLDEAGRKYTEHHAAPEVFGLELEDTVGAVTVRWSPSGRSNIEASTSMLMPDGTNASWERSNATFADSGVEVIPRAAFTQPGTYRIAVHRKLFDYPGHALEIFIDHEVP